MAAFVLVSSLVLSAASCARGEPEPKSESSLEWLGTTTTITIYDRPEPAIFDAAFSRVREIHEHMSAQLETSEVSLVNRNAGIGPAVVSADTFFVIETALETAAGSGGAFDPTVGPLVELWDITGEQHLPTPEELAKTLPLVDYRLVETDAERRAVYLPVRGMRLDLGAIAKGYAADEAARILTEHGVESAIIDFGGNIYVVGNRPDGSPWRVALQNPFLPRGNYFARYRASGEAVVTSGTYERFMIRDGVRYHHIFDPETGYPSETGVDSVTIIANESILADAYSTAAFVLGPERGLEYIRGIPGVEAVFVRTDGRLSATAGITGGSSALEILDPVFEFPETGSVPAD